MKKLGLAALLLAAAAGTALASHSIGIFEDQAALDCEIADPGGGSVKMVYIVHLNESLGVFGSAWRLEWDPGMTMTYVSDDAGPLYKVGNAQDGASISYTQCTAGTFLIDSVTFLSYGTSSPCSYVRLGPHPTQGHTMIDCGFRYLPFVSGEAIVNADGTCSCFVRTELTTWGTIKALYR
jgi:hypothetical protein